MANRIMRRIIILAFLFIFLFLPSSICAQENSFVTIINPLRISSYTKDYLESFKAEKFEVESRGLPATWLVTYDVLSRDGFVDELRQMDSAQEIGILLEVTEPFAKAAGVKYNRVDDNWHRATSLFLSGYEQKDRVKLIDKVFELFKTRFGYYPKSVGSWWTDSFSQNYMKKKYGITGNLGVSDQYDLDGYSVWGTWWSVPYYPSKINTAIPGQEGNKLEVLQFRWASRDPLNGYNIETSRTPSMYSLQDYRFAGLADSYFQNLLELYAIQKPYNSFGHATVGLEGDLSPDIYSSLLASHLDKVKNLQDSMRVKVLTMKDFADWYFMNFSNLSPKSIISSNDLLGSKRRVFWFQNPYYRIGIEYDLELNNTRIIDLREYYSNLEEPNYSEPNKQFNLYINLPFKVDTVIKPDSAITLDLGKFQNIQENSLIFEKGKVEFKDKEVILPEKTIRINNKFEVPSEGLVYRDYSYTLPFTVKSRLPIPEPYLLVGILILGAAVVSIFKKRGVIIVVVFVFVLVIGSIIISPDFKFYISQDEYNALKVLGKFSRGGKVLVYEKDCLNCDYQSKFKPAAMAGKKGYVEKYSGQPVEINFKFQIAKTSKEARKILKDKSIKYVYLSKYGDSIENLPYLPQDLGLTRTYINSNAEIWKVK